MKKILSILMLICTLSIALPSEIKAQVYTYRTTAYAYQKTDSYGNWGKWSEWLDSSMDLTINFNTDQIVIYSPTTQRYQITKHIRNYTDNSGGKQVEFAAVDQDGDKCHIRLRIEKSGSSQLYVDFNNIRWCYCVVRTN